jgi:Tol biopolymer transport system component
VLRELVAQVIRRLSPTGIALASVSAVLAAMPATARPEQGVAAAGAKIVFQRYDPGTGRARVFVVGADGSGARRSTLPAAPTFSPDGRALVYRVNDRRFARLYVADLHGRARRLILRETPAHSCLDPTWSPDSRMLAYTRDCDVDFQQIGVVNADGSGRRILTGRWNQNPAWSPDGRTIAFTGAPTRTTWRLFLMDARGRGRKRIPGSYTAPEPTPNTPPTWTRDGRSILYLYDHVAGLCAVDRDGGRCRELLPEHSVRDFDVHGRKLVVSAAGPSDAGWEIYVLGVDGSGLRRLTDNRVYDTDPRWSRDGRRIAFTSSRDGNSEIYVMNADGTNQTNVSRNPAAEGRPVWTPVGSAL